MTRNLLICAAIDLEAGTWFADCWPRIVASLRLGKAGDIAQTLSPGAGLAVRCDSLPGSENPVERHLDINPGAGGALTLIAGRIMQREALAARLGVSFRSGDAELYAAAYAALGEACDAEITGEYAVIQWFAAQRLVRLARSPLQAPPLHVWRDRHRLVASSIPRAIFAAGVQPRIDQDRLADVALRNFTDGARSYYFGLERVPCGAVVRHGRDLRELRRYWSIESLRPLQGLAPAEAVRMVRRELVTAVETALEGSRQPAVALSGGLDSQTVACTTLTRLGDAALLHSYTAVPVAAWLPKADQRLIYDERDHVEALGKRFPGLRPHFLTAEHAVTGEDLDRLLLLGSWPSANEMNMHWVHAIHREAARDGCDIMLHGELGDSALSYHGHTALPHWLVRGRWLKLSRELAAFDDRRSLPRRLISRAAMPLLPVSVRKQIDRARGQLRSPFDSWCPLEPSHAATSAALDRAERAGHDPWFYSLRSAAQERAAIIAAPLSEGPELSLALRLLYGVERRDPTGYRPLWELCARLPDAMFLRDGIDRWLVREALRGQVADSVRLQRRAGIQSADMLGRIHRDRDMLVSRLVGQVANEASEAEALLDTSRMVRILQRCNGPQAEGERDWLRVAAMVPRGVALARFVQYVEGRNHG